MSYGKTGLLLPAAGALALAWVAPAAANPFDIELSETGYSTLIINGNTPGVTTGAISYGTWTITIDSGTSGSAPSIDVSSNDTANTTGSLTVTLGETGLTSPAGNTAWNTQFSGNFSNASGTTVSLNSYVDQTDTMFGTGTSLGSTLSSTASPFALSEIGTADITTTPYALTLVMSISDAPAGATYSLDGSVTYVPEPASLLLFGSGLIGLAAIRRRLRSA